MFEYSHLSIGNNHPLVLESIIAQQSEDSDDFIVDSRMAQIFSESNGGFLNENCNLEQLKFLSQVIRFLFSQFCSVLK